MAAHDFPLMVSPDRGLSWRASGGCRSRSGCCCSTCLTPGSCGGNYSNVPTSIWVCSFRDRRANIRGVEDAGISVGGDQQPYDSSVAIPPESAAAAVALPSTTAALAAVRHQATPSTQLRLGTMRNSLTREVGDICDSCVPSGAVAWEAANAAAAPPAAEAASATKAATIENAALRASRGGGAGVKATRDVPVGPLPALRYMHCNNYHARTPIRYSSNMFNSRNCGSSRNYGSGISCSTRNIDNDSNCAGGSSCCSSGSRSCSATVHRLPVSRSTYAACSSNPVAASAASAATSREQKLGLHGLKKQSDGREQQLLQQQQFQKLEDEEPKMLQIMRTHAFLHLTSGAVAGAVSRTATAPLDRVKVMLQLQPFSVPLRQAVRVIMQQELSGNAAAAAAVPTAAVAAGVSSSTTNAGNLTNCLKVVPETAVKFYSYDICKHALAHRKQQQQQQQSQQEHQTEPEVHLQLLDRFLCGATAGLCAQLLIYPMELVKTRLAAYGPGCMYTGVLQCFKAIYKEGGFRRLYRGVGPSLLGIIPYAGIDLAVFETLKEAYVKGVIIPKQQQQVEQQQLLLRATCSNCSPETSPPGMVSFAPGTAAAAGTAAPASGVSRVRCRCDESSSTNSGLPPASPPAAVLLLMGGCSSLIGQVLAYPTALVRTRMQVDGSGGKPLLYRSSAAAAAAAVRQGGFRGLYRGLQANCCKALPAVSLSWIVYEKMKYAISNFERDWTQRVEQQRLAARNRP
ncbi:LOW QUALITY PROTEIN: mitochondrial carrier domain-containing protein, putative [Eimeria mitis]|uniref:Mitochondrial carrier domain-containing protein, putative n=1 Tax=Eimeria mitis TaxID=44415 RepID=U6KJQ5_9EIME|nr:LOW QUALITY PROTEIN: mitochondrial carrier domain-containing protein, putative [Eimeria mitis]CDJ36487.1 mitochondrial carrier domain-containing protein, putative [Eimeria mitis]